MDTDSGMDYQIDRDYESDLMKEAPLDVFVKAHLFHVVYGFLCNVRAASTFRFQSPMGLQILGRICSRLRSQ